MIHHVDVQVVSEAFSNQNIGWNTISVQDKYQHVLQQLLSQPYLALQTLFWSNTGSNILHHQHTTDINICPPHSHTPSASLADRPCLKLNNLIIAHKQSRNNQIALTQKKKGVAAPPQCNHDLAKFGKKLLKDICRACDAMLWAFFFFYGKYTLLT